MHREQERWKNTADAAHAELAAIRSERDQLSFQSKELATTRQALEQKLVAAQHSLVASYRALAAQEKEAELLARHLADAQTRAEKLDQIRLALVRELAESRAQSGEFPRSDEKEL